MRVKIISDGSAAGTKIIDLGTGQPIAGVARIDFDPLLPDSMVRGKITVIPLALEMQAEMQVTSWNSNMDVAPWDVNVMLRGESGYHKPHEVFIINGYRKRDWHNGNWNDMTGTPLMDSGWKPTAWRHCTEDER